MNFIGIASVFGLRTYPISRAFFCSLWADPAALEEQFLARVGGSYGYLWQRWATISLLSCCHHSTHSKATRTSPILRRHQLFQACSTDNLVSTIGPKIYGLTVPQLSTLDIVLKMRQSKIEIILRCRRVVFLGVRFVFLAGRRGGT